VSCNSQIFEEFIVAKGWEVRPSVLVIIMCKRYQQLKKEEVGFAQLTNTLLKDYPPINVFYSFHVSPHTLCASHITYQHIIEEHITLNGILRINLQVSLELSKQSHNIQTRSSLLSWHILRVIIQSIIPNSMCYYSKLCSAITMHWGCNILPSKVIYVL
jgi:hypothetical protein